jgi:pyruvate dehydrogenase (quinone)
MTGTSAIDASTRWDVNDAVLDVHTDPGLRPIPPHADFDEVKSLTKALLTGDEDAWDVVRTGVKQKLPEFVPEQESGS